MVGGNGEKKTLRLVSQYADARNLITFTHTEAQQELDVLRRHCDDLGRDHTQIRKTAIYAGPTLRGGDLDAFTEEMAHYARLGIGIGIDTVMVSPPITEPARWIEAHAAPAAPAVRRMSELG
ncbi:hypothetical protein [Streptomyces panacea]|uniref:hypothetical protein n=1 Tax=Streptomyces panacea TaxID=3035064 RepID=UPI00339C4F0B